MLWTSKMGQREACTKSIHPSPDIYIYIYADPAMGANPPGDGGCLLIVDP